MKRNSFLLELNLIKVIVLIKSEWLFDLSLEREFNRIILESRRTQGTIALSCEILSIV